MKFVALAVMLGALAAAPQNAPNNSDETKAVRWMREAAVPFSADAQSPALDRLADRLAMARVVGIGEAIHGSHEDQAFKVALIETLVRRGQIDVVAVEANHEAGLDFDNYIEHGVGDPAVLVASDNFFKISKDDEFADLM